MSSVLSVVPHRRIWHNTFISPQFRCHIVNSTLFAVLTNQLVTLFLFMFPCGTAFQ